MMLAIDSTISLANGVAMPLLGLGTFRAGDGQEVENAVSWALEAGYRSVDTATVYKNEGGVGRALRRSGLKREEIFVTTKVWNSAQRKGNTLAAFEKSLDRLGLESVDLYLVHWPVAGAFLRTWSDMERIYHSGRARAIGVSNFMLEHLSELLTAATIIPAVNQIEFHPRLQSPELVDFCRAHDIQVEAWSPLMKGRVAGMQELQAIGAPHGKSAVQVTLRWMLQREIVTIPKSSNRQRISDNADLFDFELTADDMAQINSLDRGQRVGPDPYSFGF